LTVNANQRALHRQISEKFLFSRKIPFTATVSEHGHGRDTTWSLRAKQAPYFITEDWPGSSWIVELVISGKRAGKPAPSTPLPHQPAHHVNSFAATGEGPLVH
jgi:hypothetical protein